jgi:hypothetical protein
MFDVKGGGNARRIGEKMRDELGIPFARAGLAIDCIYKDALAAA